MVNASKIKLYNEGVNGGVPVDLNGISFKYSMSALVNNEPAPGKWDITSNSVEGYRNPTITVSGALSSDTILVTNSVTEQLLKAFIRSENQTYLSIKYGDDSLEQYFTNINGTTVSKGGESCIAVSISSISINDRSGGANGQVLNFNIDFIEDNE